MNEVCSIYLLWELPHSLLNKMTPYLRNSIFAHAPSLGWKAAIYFDLKASHTHLGWYTSGTVNTVPKSLSAQTCTVVPNSHLHIRKLFIEG